MEKTSTLDKSSGEPTPDSETGGATELGGELGGATELGGTKFDGEKPRMDLLSTAALTEISKVLTFGARKYDDHNWRKGFAWSRLYGAALRHLLAHMDGEDVDPETRLSHLAHLGCCVMFLIEHEAKGLGTDDRYKGEMR